jgi:hypothetical protein
LAAASKSFVRGTADAETIPTVASPANTEIITLVLKLIRFASYDNASEISVIPE